MKKCFEYPNKKRYNTHLDADTATLLINDKDISIYKCNSCNGWHLTSKNKII